MATLSDRIKAFLNPVSAPDNTDAPTSPVIPETMVSKFQVERYRMAVIRDCIEMYEMNPLVERIHRDYARGLVGNGFIVKTDNAEAAQIASDLQDRLDLNRRLEDWVRLTSRDGDSFLELSVDDAMFISKATRKPTLRMHRATNDADEFEDPTRSFWMAPIWYMGIEPPSDAVWFPEWKIIHARNNHDEEQRYGTPMMRSARKQFKYMEEGELNVAVRRKIGGAQIRQHVIEGAPSDVEAYKTNNKEALGRLAAVIDLFSNKPGSLTVFQGDGQIDKIGDLEHHIQTMFAASEVPMELIVYGGDLDRDILGEKKEHYQENLMQGREWTMKEILKPLLERQWMLQGILPADLDYQIIWRTTQQLTPADLNSLIDAMLRAKLLGITDDAIKSILAQFIPDADLDILSPTGLGASDLAAQLKGISI
jgi:hypothetical protein